MKQIQVKLIGGPFDGETRWQAVLPGWNSLELQVRSDPLVHVYFGSLTADPVELSYLGVRQGVDAGA